MFCVWRLLKYDELWRENAVWGTCVKKVVHYWVEKKEIKAMNQRRHIGYAAAKQRRKLGGLTAHHEILYFMNTARHKNA